MNYEHEVSTDSLPVIVGITPAEGETPEKVGIKIEGISAEALTDGTLQLNMTYDEATELVEKLIELAEYDTSGLSPHQKVAMATDYWKGAAAAARKARR